MLWLVSALFAGFALGLCFRFPEKGTRWLDKSLSVSLFIMLFCLGLKIGGNEQLSQTIDNHALTVFVLLASASLSSIAWGWWLERRWLR